MQRIGRAWKRIVAGLAAAIVLGIWIEMFIWTLHAKHPGSDFPNHYEMGRRFVHGIFIYADHLNVVYPPFWAMAHAAFTIVPANTAMLLLYPLGVGAMVAMVALLKKLADRHWPADSDTAFWSAAMALFLASGFLVRDLTEVGVNTFLLLLTWLAIWLWIQRREWLGAICLGLAAALKCTPAIFILYFLYKRQWKMTLLSAFMTAVFTLAPMLVLGPSNFGRTFHAWTGTVWQGVSTPDPSRGVYSTEKTQNFSLRPALARYLMNLPYGHALRPETSDSPDRPNAPPDPFYIQILDLSPQAANWIVRGITLALLATLAWLFRKPVTERNDPQLLWECAAVSVAALLLSPVTWGQHCVAALPALFFIQRADFTKQNISKWTTALIWGWFLLAIAPHPDLLGRRFNALANAYHIKTAALAMLLAATILCRTIRKRERIA